MMNEKNTIELERGILYWEAETSETIIWDSRSGRPETVYTFPWRVKTGMPNNIETGTALFKTMETRKRETEGIKLRINGEEDESAKLDFFAPPVIFINEETEEPRDYPLTCLEITRADGESLFLYDDLFIRAVMTIDGGTPINLCGVPVSRENPLEHLGEDGEYDMNEIRSWRRFLMIKTGGVVALPEAMENDKEV